MTLDREDVEAIARRIAELVTLPRPTYGRLLTVAEAMEYTGHRSRRAFYTWAHNNRVRPVRRGMYSPNRLAVAMRETGRGAA